MLEFACSLASATLVTTGESLSILVGDTPKGVLTSSSRLDNLSGCDLLISFPLLSPAFKGLRRLAMSKFGFGLDFNILKDISAQLVEYLLY
uniref:Uncharacterized protein n=1 Tax=Panstrongylus lignarius TaxID=156445 RepID=A0A224Y3D3_9HEMI